MVAPRYLITALALSFAILPARAHAATWVETLTDNPDWVDGGSYVHQDFTIAADGTKVQALAYTAEVQGQGQAVRIALRSVPVGTPLEEGDWEFSDARYLSASGKSFFRLHLALDRVTARPYVIFNNNEDFDLRLATFVGDGGGDCGENHDWDCDNIVTACGMEHLYASGGFSAPRLELESVIESAADAAHVVFHLQGADGHIVVHARKELATQAWSCQVLPSEGYWAHHHTRSVAIYHDQDSRLKPQITYAVREGERGEPRQVIRSLLDYSGSPLPPMSWTPEYTVTPFVDYGTPAMAIRDEGLGEQGWASLTGIGVPALVEIGTHDYNSTYPRCPKPGVWTMDYRVAQDTAGTSWDSPEPIVAGRPCGPSMAFGWEMNPYVLYRDDALDTLMLTTRRPNEPQLWTSPETVGYSPTWSDVIFDPDLGTVSIAYLEEGESTFTVTDGYLM